MSGSDSGRSQSTLTPNVRTAVAGFALQNATPNVVTFTTPNDGQLHAYDVAASLNVTVLEVGGQVSLNYTSGGHAYSVVVFASALAAGNYTFSQNITADPNAAVTIAQTAALTGGAAQIFAAISGG
jgi:hypothetical protein